MTKGEIEALIAEARGTVREWRDATYGDVDTKDHRRKISRASAKVYSSLSRLADALALTRVENRNEVYGDLATTVSEATRDPTAPAPREVVEAVARISDPDAWSAADMMCGSGAVTMDFCQPSIAKARAIFALSAGGPSPSTANVEGDYGSSRDHAPGAGSALERGLADCGIGVPYGDHSAGESAALSAYSVLRCCGLIRAGDWRVPSRIGSVTQEMEQSRAAGRSSAKQNEGDRSRDELNTSSQPVKILPDTEHDGGEV